MNAFVSQHSNVLEVNCAGLGQRDCERLATMNEELVRAFHAFAIPMPTDVVYGSARTPWYSREYKFTTALTYKLGLLGRRSVTGGGPGIMAAGNKGGKLSGGPSYGLNIILPHEPCGNEYQTVSLNFRYFATRKFIFVKYADSFTIMPGGFGTLDEFFETVTLIQCQRSKRAPIYLVDEDFWLPKVADIQEQLFGRGYVSGSDMNLFTVVDYDVNRLVDLIVSESANVVPLGEPFDRQLAIKQNALARRSGRGRVRRSSAGQVRTISDPSASYTLYGTRVREAALIRSTGMALAATSASCYPDNRVAK